MVVGVVLLKLFFFLIPFSLSSFPLPSSPLAFIVDNRRLYPSSVHEEIEKHIMSHFSPDSTKFSSCGREDVDVRMLGEGRPFVLEVSEI